MPPMAFREISPDMSTSFGRDTPDRGFCVIRHRRRYRYCRISFRLFRLTTPLSGEGGSRSVVVVLPLDIRMPSPLPFLLTLCVVLVCVWLWWRSRSEEHTSELQSLRHLVCRLL